MKILHVLSQVELTGAEVHAVTLAEWQKSQGHEVHLVSDTLNLKTDLPFQSLAIHHAKSKNRHHSVRALKQIIIDREIDIVHAHSRAAVRVAYSAQKGLNCALVSTVHGRQHSSWSKKIFDIYGEQVIAVCGNISKHLQVDFKMDPRKIHVLGNPIDRSKIPSPVPRASGSRQLLLMGRTTGPKGEKTAQWIESIFPELLKKVPDVNILLVGGKLSQLPESTQKVFKQLEADFSGRIQHQDFVENPDYVIAASELVVGAGRVAIAAALQGKPVFTLGEFQSHGFLRLQNLQECCDSNFGDIGLGNPPSSEMNSFLDQVMDFFSSRVQNRSLPLLDELELIQKKIQSMYDLEFVGEKVLNIYKAAHFKKHVPKWFPIMMYHKVVEQPLQTQHRIFVTRENFEKHLKFYKWKGFQTLSFSELADYWHLRKPKSDFPQKPLMITFDDGYLNNLQLAVPLLKKYGFQSTIFLLANAKMKANSWDEADGTPQLPLMNEIERQQLKKTGQEIGSHGFSHQKLSSMDLVETKTEIFDSKTRLEKEFGQKINVYAYTYGIKNPWAESCVQEAGYDFGLNTTTGGLHLAENPMSVFRVSVFPEDGFFDLWKKTSPWYRKYYFNKRGE